MIETHKDAHTYRHTHTHRRTDRPRFLVNIFSPNMTDYKNLFRYSRIYLYLCDVLLYNFIGFGLFVDTMYAAVDRGTFDNHNHNVIPT